VEQYLIGEVVMPQLVQQVNRRGSSGSPLEYLNPSTTQELLLMEIYKMLYEIKELLEEEKNDKPRKSKKVNTD
jgi:hypothetical protein